MDTSILDIVDSTIEAGLLREEMFTLQQFLAVTEISHDELTLGEAVAVSLAGVPSSPVKTNMDRHLKAVVSALAIMRTLAIGLAEEAEDRDAIAEFLVIVEDILADEAMDIIADLREAEDQ